MADSESFSVACQALETSSALDKLEARGTIRIVLKSAGLDASSVAPAQMKVVVDKVLPEELRARGVEDSEASCRAICAALEGVAASEDGSSPEAVFSRLGS
jgi:hypothetical protein